MRQPVVLKRNAVRRISSGGRDTESERLGWCRGMTVVVPQRNARAHEGESVLVDILGVSQQRLDEIAAAV